MKKRKVAKKSQVFHRGIEAYEVIVILFVSSASFLERSVSVSLCHGADATNSKPQ